MQERRKMKWKKERTKQKDRKMVDINKKEIPSKWEEQI